MTSAQHKPRTLIAFAFVALVVCSVPVFGTRFLNDMEFYALFADKVLAGGCCIATRWTSSRRSCSSTTRWCSRSLA